MSDKSDKNQKNIGEIVRNTLHTGDLNHLKDLGPAVENVVRGIQSTATQVAKEVSANKPAPAQPQRPVWQGSSPPARQQRKLPGGSAGVGQVALGVLGVVAFGLCTLIFAALGAIVASSSAFWPLSAFFAVGTVACGAVLAGGLGTRKQMKRLWQYYSLLQSKKVMPYAELAAQTGYEVRDIRKDIRKARQKNLLPEVRTDAGDTCVMLGEDAWQQYLETEEARRRRESDEAEQQRRLGDPTTAEMERFKLEGEETIKKIRAANDAIPGEEISGKLSRLEASCARIFTYVEAHPDKLPECRKFMNYYLPTTLKLVEKYRQYEEMELQPANILKAKAEIESTLDTIEAAFNTLFENLYHEDTLDVATDIEVLEKMLEQEGLTGKRFTIDADGE